VPRETPLGSGPKRPFRELALELLQALDPYVYAINSSKFGIIIYSRDDYGKPTPWETLIWQEDLQLPADWTGYLSAFFLPAHRYNDSNLRISRRSARQSVQGLLLMNQAEGDSSPMRRFVRNPASSYDGVSQKQEETTPDI
jgi:hypothetical protein